ncbi:MAG: saccharopine dehydrogenase NADP-binding domain-containing protein [Candidatus Eisenbacteria bacterium]|nr:saccharopine dehydrogenase NADP-binding domain-containing protein [Candidatus Eisenbacteria bacterium]
MRMGLLGAGQQGQACVLDWLRQADVTEVRVIDTNEEALAALRGRFPDPRVVTQRRDVGDARQLEEGLAGCAAVMSAVPYFLNLAVTRAAIATRVPMVDLGGNTDVVFSQRALDPDAREAGIGILPDQGLAPGLAGILAAHGLRGMAPGARVAMRVGGLPQHPKGTLQYALVFSIHGLLNEYAGEAVILERGELARKPTLTGLETIEFASPVGRCEAAYTSGGTSTLPWTFAGKVDLLDYKTVRYPGHWERMAFLKELGLLETDLLPLGRFKIEPRELLARLLEPMLNDPSVRDLVVLRVTVEGTVDGRPCRRTYEMIDLFDEATGLTAMMRTTAFPASESALMLARGQIGARGVLAAEEVIPGEAYLRALQERGLPLRTWEDAGN